jgi:hypothetical protein
MCLCLERGTVVLNRGGRTGSVTAEVDVIPIAIMGVKESKGEIAK